MLKGKTILQAQLVLNIPHKSTPLIFKKPSFKTIYGQTERNTTAMFCDDILTLQHFKAFNESGFSAVAIAHDRTVYYANTENKTTPQPGGYIRPKVDVKFWGSGSF